MRVTALVFLLFPFLELAVLIKVGSEIGVLATFALLLLGFLVGVALLRVAGFTTLWRIRMRLAQGQMPEQEVVQGLTMAVAGALLIFPGFISDVLALICLLPVTRKALLGAVIGQVTRRAPGAQGYQPGSGHSAPHRPEVIEGEVVRRDEEKR
ncbi:FxsA family protein [Pseudomonas oryzihabitans]|uniref:FxsA family protein n=1 Tax=Pseudomonas oryzihabitans TaxID=47885 RepID=UPI00286C6CC0|nr:FxsA family protein [Pseudomonas psychrotolerans]